MPRDSVNIIKSVARTVDDIVDAVVGGRPLERLIRIAEKVGPANVARKLGVPPPGDIADKAVAELEFSLETGEPPKPPAPKALRRLFE